MLINVTAAITHSLTVVLITVACISVGWPSLHNHRLDHWYIFLFKAILCKLPPYLCSLLTPKVTTRKCNLRSYGQIMYDIPRTRTVFGESAFFKFFCTFILV